MAAMVLKVSARSNPNAVAGAIAGLLRERGEAHLRVIGAGALNQAIKAIAIARFFVQEDGIDPVCIPEFQDLGIDGVNRTAIYLTVEDRAQVPPSPQRGGRTGRRARDSGDGSPAESVSGPPGEPGVEPGAGLDGRGADRVVERHAGPGDRERTGVVERHPEPGAVR